MADRAPRGSIRHEHYFDAAEGLEWSSLHAEAERLDRERQAVTARINVLRQRACQRACQRALAARRRQAAADA